MTSMAEQDSVTHLSRYERYPYALSEARLVLPLTKTIMFVLFLLRSLSGAAPLPGVAGVRSGRGLLRRELAPLIPGAQPFRVLPGSLCKPCYKLNNISSAQVLYEASHCVSPVSVCGLPACLEITWHNNTKKLLLRLAPAAERARAEAATHGGERGLCFGSAAGAAQGPGCGGALDLHRRTASEARGIHRHGRHSHGCDAPHRRSLLASAASARGDLACRALCCRSHAQRPRAGAPRPRHQCGAALTPPARGASSAAAERARAPLRLLKAMLATTHLALCFPRLAVHRPPSAAFDDAISWFRERGQLS